ncbi:hypothetical protein K438DRAFT_1847987, partial [Mycena galopus ATCC 62051]
MADCTGSEGQRTSTIAAPNRISLLLLRFLLLRALWSDSGFALDLELDESFTSLAFGLDGFAALRRRPKFSTIIVAQADVVRRRREESTQPARHRSLSRKLLHALAMRGC